MSASTDRTGLGMAQGKPYRPTLPQVNLLPPEIRAARGLSVLKRWLGVSLAGTVALCAIAYAGSVVSASMAAKELTAEQEVTSELQVEEQKYAEVPRVLNALATVRLAREAGMATEVQWRAYLDAITAVLPHDVSIESFSVTPASTAAAVGSIDPLRGPSVGEIQFNGRAATTPDVASWVDSLNSIPGFESAWVTSSTIAATESTTYYTVDGSVQYTDAAFANRFDAVEGTS